MKVEKPVKMDNLTVKSLEEAFAMDCTIEEACLMAKITKQTYYNWIESFPKMKDRFDLLRNEPVLAARKTVVEAIKVNPGIALSYLERKKKDEFSPRQEVEHSTPKGFSLKITADDDSNTMGADEETSGGVEVS